MAKPPKHKTDVITGTKEAKRFVDQSKGSVLSPDMQIETGYNRIITIAKPPAEVARMSLEYLRLAAETYYVTDLNSIKIEELWELPQFNNLAIHKLMMWCHDYGWTEKRKVFQEKCILKVQEAVSNKLVKLRIEQMDKVKELCDDIWEKIKDPDAPIKVVSYEGIVKTYLQAVEMLDKLRDSVSSGMGNKEINPDTETRNSPDIEISKEEARSLAMILVKQRQLRAPNSNNDIITEGEIVGEALDKPAN